MLKPIPEVMTVPKFESGGIISFHEKDVPAPGAGQLLLQVGANALCGSERGQFYDGSEVTPGHEGAGIVVAAGPETSTPVGTTGAVFLMDFCGECRSCALGFTNQCRHKRADYGFNVDGGFGVYELVNENVFFAINFNHRFAKPVQMAKAAIDAGRLGQIVFATWRFGGEGGGGHPHANLIET